MVNLTYEQLEGVIKLVNQEIEVNISTGDDAYNVFWENINTALQAELSKLKEEE